MTKHTCRDCGADLVRKNPNGPWPHRCESCRAAFRKAYVREKHAEYVADGRRRKPARQWTCESCGADAGSSPRRIGRCVRCRSDGVAPCSVDGCTRPVRARGVCSAHYKRDARADGRIVPEPWSDRRRANYARRRALKAGAAAGAPFTSAEVFERDGWLCGLCSQPVDSAVEYPDPASASLDHVVPLSRGGEHSLENVQLAHLSCNVSKGAAVA